MLYCNWLVIVQQCGMQHCGWLVIVQQCGMVHCDWLVIVQQWGMLHCGWLVIVQQCGMLHCNWLVIATVWHCGWLVIVQQCGMLHCDWLVNVIVKFKFILPRTFDSCLCYCAIPNCQASSHLIIFLAQLSTMHKIFSVWYSWYIALSLLCERWETSGAPWTFIPHNTSIYVVDVQAGSFIFYEWTVFFC